MATNEAKVVVDGQNLSVALPITAPKSKVRLKVKDGKYRRTVKTREEIIPNDAYVEWQIGYALPATEENRSKTTLSEFVFSSSPKRNRASDSKYPYELAEILKYSYDLGLITADEIAKVKAEIEAFNPNELIDVHPDVRICRTNPVVKTLNGVEFHAMEVRYPLFVHRFGAYDIFTEIMVREKQRAVGSQPMLYVCLPMCLLFDANGKPPIGRFAKTKEAVRWQIGKTEAALGLELFKIFGMLSAKHRFDVIAILNALF